jgi:signal transduction histidine kinase
MAELWNRLFNADFMPHGHCYFWSPDILWLHTVSDAVIALSYFTIPLALVALVRRREDLVFNWIFLMFGAFIFACGTTHAMDILTTWVPVYRIEGVIKMVTALISFITAVAIWPLLPRVLHLPSPAQLRAANDALRREVDQRVLMEDEMRRLNAELEQRVEQRTAELQETNAELERSNSELDRFAYVASHDLRAPLQAIDNLATWLSEDLEEVITDDSRQQLDLLHRRVRRMEGLLEGLLSYSRVGRMEAKVETVDVAHLVEEVVGVLHPPETFEVDTEGELPVFETWRLPLEQVLQNLLGNAFKHHGGPRGRVVVGAREEGDFYEFWVSDDGPGIAPEHRERAFEIFQTLRARDEVEGTGIGLAIVKKTIEALGGRIWIDPGAEKGTTFRFTWPREEDVGESGEA